VSEVEPEIENPPNVKENEIGNVVDDGNNVEVQMCFNTGIVANDLDPDDKEGSENDHDEEPDSDNNFGICDDEMDTDWLADAFDDHNIKNSFEAVGD
jgi:hypothetical protein